MRRQQVVRIVDASAAQERVIIWLACHHKVSVTTQQAVLDPTIIPRVTREWSMDCPFCPDEPQPGASTEKSVKELYREAGEP